MKRELITLITLITLIAVEGISTFAGAEPANGVAPGTPPPVCPVGYRIFGATNCVASDGTTFVFRRGGWYRESSVPGALVIENVLTGKREYSDGADFTHFTPMNCEWNVPPYQYLYAHGSRMMTTDGRLWDCNNGQFYYAGSVPTQSYAPVPERGAPQRSSEDGTEEEDDRAGVGAEGTIGRGT